MILNLYPDSIKLIDFIESTPELNKDFDKRCLTYTNTETKKEYYISQEFYLIPEIASGEKTIQEVLNDVHAHLKEVYVKRECHNYNYSYLNHNNETVKNSFFVRDKDYPLRDFQKEALNNILEAFKRGEKEALLTSPTRSGKTTIAIKVIEHVARLKNPQDTRGSLFMVFSGKTEVSGEWEQTAKEHVDFKNISFYTVGETSRNPEIVTESLKEFSGMKMGVSDINKILEKYDEEKRVELVEYAKENIRQFSGVVSNPPYQEVVSNAKNAPSRQLYPEFMLLGTRIADYSTMVHPVRSFITNTIVNKETLEKVKNNKHIKVVKRFDDASKVFPHTDIKGGVIITAYDAFNLSGDNNLNNLIPLNKQKVKEQAFSKIDRNITEIFYNKRLNKYTSKYVEFVCKKGSSDNILETNIMNKHPEFFTNNETMFKLVGLFNKKRCVKNIKDGVFNVDKVFTKYNVALNRAAGKGVDGDLGETFILPPNTLMTASFHAVGAFDTLQEAQNCEKYLNSRFSRYLLSIRKITQQSGMIVWENLPLISFSESNELFMSDDDLPAKHPFKGLTLDERLCVFFDISEELVDEILKLKAFSYQKGRFDY